MGKTATKIRFDEPETPAPALEGEVKRTKAERDAEAERLVNIDSIGHVTAEYSGNQIQVLEGLEAVRQNVPMYIGGKDTNGLHHLFTEVSDNAVDEALAGYCTHIDVTLHADGSLSVRDNGRGIPVDINGSTACRA